MEIKSTRLVRGIVCFIGNGVLLLFAAAHAPRQLLSDDDLGRLSLLGGIAFSLLGLMTAYGMMSAVEGKRFRAFEVASTLSFLAAVFMLTSRVWFALLA